MEECTNGENMFDETFHINNGTERPDKMLFELKIEDSPFKFEMDTGSPITAISEKFFNINFGNKFILNETKRMFKSYTGNTMIPLGTFKVWVTHKDKKEKLEMFVMPGVGSPIVGRDWLLFALKIINGQNIMDKMEICQIN